MKFKIGNKVKVIKVLDDGSFSEASLQETIDNSLGKMGMVTHIDDTGNYAFKVAIFNSNFSTYYKEEELELVIDINNLED